MVVIVDTLNEGLRRIYRRVARRASAAGARVVFIDDAGQLLADHDACAQMEVVLCDGTLPVDARLMEIAPRLRGVLSAIIGSEGFVRHDASAAGVLLGNGQVFENWRSVAEATVLMVLAATYELNEAQAILRERRPRPAIRGARMLHGKQIGFIGFGRVAQETARLLSTWGMQMVYCARNAADTGGLSVRRVELDALLRSSDIVVLLAPLNASTRGMLDARRLALMKPGAYLINTARGGIIDEDALHDALREGKLAGASLDTFEVEPLPAHSKLRTLERVVLTPHIVGHTAEAFEAIEDNAVEGILRLLAGEPPPFLMNPEALPLFHRKAAAVSA